MSEEFQTDNLGEYQPSNFERMLLKVIDDGSEEDLIHALAYFPGYIQDLGDKEELRNMLTSSVFIKAKIQHISFEELINDFPIETSDTFVSEIRKALMLSSNRIIDNISEIEQQLTGRLLNSSNKETKQFVNRLNHFANNVYFRPLAPFQENIKSPLLMALEGHKESINDIIERKKGGFIISCGYDNAIKVWNRHTGTLVFDLIGHKQQISHMELSNDERYLLSDGGFEAKLFVWDLQNGTLHGVFKNYLGSRKKQLVIIEGQNIVALPTWDFTIELFNFETGEVEKTLEGHSGEIMTMLQTPDKQYLISYGTDNLVCIWDLEFQMMETQFRFPRNQIPEVLFCTNDHMYISKKNNEIEYWDIRLGFYMGSLTASSRITKSIITNDSKKIVVGIDDGSVIIWETHSHIKLKTLLGHSSKVYEIIESRDRQRIFTVEKNGSVNIWDINTGDLLQVIPEQSNFINKIDESIDGQFLFCNTRDYLHIWNIETAELIKNFGRLDESYSHIRISQDTQTLITAANDFSPKDGYYTIKLWNIKNLEMHKDSYKLASIDNLLISTSKNFVISKSSDNQIRIWDRKGQVVQKLESPVESANILSISLCKNDEILAIGYSNNALGLHNIANGSFAMVPIQNSSVSLLKESEKCIFVATKDGTIWKLDLEINEVTAKSAKGTSEENKDNYPVELIENQTNGLLYMRKYYDSTFKVYSSDTLELTYEINHGSVPVEATLLSKDESMFFIGCDRYLSAWNAKIGKKVFSMKQASEFLHEDDQGNIIVIPKRSGSIKLVNRETGNIIREFENKKDRINSVTLLENNTLFVGSRDGVINVFSLDSENVLFTLIGHFEQIEFLQRSEDGRFLISADSNNTINIWSIFEQKRIGTINIDSVISWGPQDEDGFNLSAEKLAIEYIEEINRLIVGTRNGEVLFFQIENLDTYKNNIQEM